jgi:GNAT superfamily N-acetyltransferase
MSDLLVKLYALPERYDTPAALTEDGIRVIRALPMDKGRVRAFVESEFDSSWANEVEAAFARQPATCFVAARGDRVLGFAAFEATAPDYFGPTGVAKEMRGRGLGKALLLKSLLAMREMGYGYAIIGGSEEANPFYEAACGAFVIPGSEKGIYARMIKPWWD